MLLYVLGLSYRAVVGFLAALGCAVSKTTVHNNVPKAGKQALGQQRRVVAQSEKRPVIGTDGTCVKAQGEQVGIQVVVERPAAYRLVPNLDLDHACGNVGIV